MVYHDGVIIFKVCVYYIFIMKYYFQKYNIIIIIIIIRFGFNN